MARRKRTGYVPPEEIIARIERHRLSYYLSRPDNLDPSGLGDEALLDIEALIEIASPRHSSQVGETIEITLACARSYRPEDATSQQNRPVLFGVTLTRSQRSSLSYLPSEAFWPIPSLIKDGLYTHIELRFSPLFRGHGDLLSIWFGKAPILDELQAAPAKA